MLTASGCCGREAVILGEIKLLRLLVFMYKSSLSLEEWKDCLKEDGRSEALVVLPGGVLPWRQAVVMMTLLVPRPFCGLLVVCSPLTALWESPFIV